jgi:lipid-binding SYLF domain-containing protein
MAMINRIARVVSAVAILIASAVVSGGCSTAPKTEVDRTALKASAQDTIKLYKFTDPGLEEHFTKSSGYAVFPKVTKGGAGLGGAHGYGVVYQDHKPVGWCDLSQGTIGLQLGGQSFSELIFFEDGYALERFKRGEFAMAANASAVASADGAAATAKFNGGVLVFTMAKGGLMLEAAVGGQNFSYEPM